MVRKVYSRIEEPQLRPCPLSGALAKELKYSISQPVPSAEEVHAAFSRCNARSGTDRDALMKAFTTFVDWEIEKNELESRCKIAAIQRKHDRERAHKLRVHRQTCAAIKKRIKKHQAEIAEYDRELERMGAAH